MVNIGIIGIGFMGYTHFEGARDLRNGRISAIATRNEKKLAGDWRGIQGNFGPPAGEVDLTGVTPYADYHELLADPNIGLVDICLPTDLHEQVVLDALQAGKPVMVEKPIAIDLPAAEKMVRAAKDAGVPLLVGHVLPFFPEFRFVAEAIQSGKYGKLLAAHFRRVIAPPNWSEGMSDFRKLGGWGIDLHIHDNHYVSYVCGIPKAVFSRGILREGFVNHVHTQYIYDNDEQAVSCVSGGINAKGFPFGHGFEIYLEQATLIYDAGTYGSEWVVNRPLTVIDQQGGVTVPDLPGGSEWYSAFTTELQVAVDVISSNASPQALDSTLALNALKICYAEAESIQTGQVIKLS